MGAALAACLGILALLRTWYWTPASLLEGAGGLPPHELLAKLTYVLGLAVAGTCLWGTLLGSILPLVIRRLGADPALVSSPAIATLSDVSGIVIYASIAAVFFF
jgi:magnesium transporter